MTCLEAPSQELVLHLQVVALVYLRLEGLIEDGVARVILNVLPASVAVAEVDLRLRKPARYGKDDTNTWQGRFVTLTAFPRLDFIFFFSFLPRDT